MNGRPNVTGRGILTCLCIGILCAFAASASAAKKRHENPKDFNFIEEEGWGDWNGVMTGRIIDKYGDPIPHITIRVHSKDIKTKTDANGFFTIKGLQKGGHYSLIIDAKGYDYTVARWIPIPKYQSADIGDYYIEPEPIWTNFWQITSNLVENGTWMILSNFVDIADNITNIHTVAEWESFTREREQRYHHYYGMLAPTNELPMIDERPALAPARTNAASENAEGPKEGE